MLYSATRIWKIGAEEKPKNELLQDLNLQNLKQTNALKQADFAREELSFSLFAMGWHSLCLLSALISLGIFCILSFNSRVLGSSERAAFRA